MLYVDFQMFKARRHLKKARTDFEAGGELLRLAEAGGRPVEMLKAKQQELARGISEVEQTLSEYRDEIDGLYEDDTDLETKEVRQPVVVLEPPRTPQRRLVHGTVAFVVPIVLAVCLSYWIPYNTITCRQLEQTVECRIQPVLFGVIPFGEDQTFVLKKVTGEYRDVGYRKAKPGFLTFNTAEFEIPAARAPMTAKSINSFLTHPRPQPLRVSDGKTFTGLYLPWLLVAFAIVCSNVAHGDYDIVGNAVTRESRVAYSHLRVGSIRFMMGSFLAFCVAWLAFAYVIDIHQATYLHWLILFAVIALGGVLNVIRPHRLDRQSERLDSAVEITNQDSR